MKGVSILNEFENHIEGEILMNKIENKKHLQKKEIILLVIIFIVILVLGICWALTREKQPPFVSKMTRTSYSSYSYVSDGETMYLNTNDGEFSFVFRDAWRVTRDRIDEEGSNLIILQPYEIFPDEERLVEHVVVGISHFRSNGDPIDTSTTTDLDAIVQSAVGEGRTVIESDYTTVDDLPAMYTFTVKSTSEGRVFQVDYYFQKGTSAFILEYQQTGDEVSEGWLNHFLAMRASFDVD